MGGGKSGLVSIVCACATDSGNLRRTSPILYKLHVVVMWRNNQTRYMWPGYEARYVTDSSVPMSDSQYFLGNRS